MTLHRVLIDPGASFDAASIEHEFGYVVVTKGVLDTATGERLYTYGAIALPGDAALTNASQSVVAEILVATVTGPPAEGSDTTVAASVPTTADATATTVAPSVPPAPTIGPDTTEPGPGPRHDRTGHHGRAAGIHAAAADASDRSPNDDRRLTQMKDGHQGAVDALWCPGGTTAR